MFTFLICEIIVLSSIGEAFKNGFVIADEIGISVRYYHDLETGKKMPTLAVIEAIASVYQMKLSQLCRLIEEADK